MTTSTDNQLPPTPKLPKAKGPIRTEAIVPIAILIALFYAYFTLMFDANLKSGFEWIGTKVNGAEVNVGSVSTSFLKGSFELTGLQVTDKSEPVQNIVQVGRIHFQFLWDALLRAKFVVNDASIDNIQIFTKRKKPGFIVPITPEKEGGPSALDKIEEGVLNQAKDQFNNNVLGDVAQIIDGVDPEAQLKNIQASLKSEARIKELEAMVKEKQKVWEERLQKMPHRKELDELVQRGKSIKIDTSNPAKAAASFKEIEKLVKEADEKIKMVNQASKELKSDVNTIDSSYKELEKLIQDDIKDLQTRLKIPDLDVADFSTQLFGKMFQVKVAQIKKYAAVAKQYMPPPKTAEEKQPDIMPHKRGSGKNIKFPITTGYPLFWLQHAGISSKASDGEFSGDIKGEIKDVTTDPAFIKKPVVITVSGNFPKQQILGLNATVTLDHTTDNAVESMVAYIASFPIEEKKLSDSNDVRLIMQKGVGQSHLEATLKDEQLQISLKNEFKNLNYDIGAKSKLVKEILTNVVNGIPVITLNAQATGSWSHIDWHINSNLGKELGDGFKKEISAKVEEAKRKLKAMIDGRINGEKAKLEQSINIVKGGITKQVDSKKGEIEKSKSDIEKQQKQATKAKSKDLEKAGKKLLKGLGF